VTDLQAYPVTVDPSGTLVLHLFAGDTVFPPVQGGKIVLDATKYPALQQAEGAVLGHPDGLPGPMIITRPGASPELVALSALCTHLQCTVQPVGGGLLHCPCHGSGFDLRGAVLTQPASFPLHQYDLSGDATGMVTIAVPPTCS
jgi:Rieske Fe-S protein